MDAARVRIYFYTEKSEGKREEETMRKDERKRERENVSKHFSTLIPFSVSFALRATRHYYENFKQITQLASPRIDTNLSFADFIAAIQFSRGAKFIPRLVKSYCRDNEIKVFRMNAPTVQQREKSADVADQRII